MSKPNQEGLGARLGNLAQRLRRRFFKMTLREKGLALLFVVALVTLWFSDQISRHQGVWSEISIALRDKSDQREWLAHESEIRQNHQNLIADINIEALPSIDEVRGNIDSIVRRYFTSFDLGQTRSEANIDLTFSSIPLTVQKANYEQLKSFVAEVRQSLPSVSLERVSIRPNPKDDQFLEANFLFKSIENTK